MQNKFKNKHDLEQINVRVERFDPQSKKFYKREYTINADRFSTVLSALLYIKERLDPTLSIRYSCRMGICGSCAMVINGKPSLACETNLLRESKNNKTIVVGPLRGFPLLRDLVTDFDEFFNKHKSVKPWLVTSDADEQFDPKKEYPQTPYERDTFLPFSECIKCGLCVDACPVTNTNKEFVGPQALGQAYRYIKDSRDTNRQERLAIIDTLNGVWGCDFVGACSVVCPKSVDPALAIQMLKAEISKHALLGKKPAQTEENKVETSST